MAAPPDLAAAVRTMRKRAGLTQAELARRAGVPQSAISNYERGEKVPTVATLDRLATAAGVSLDISLDVDRSASTPLLADLRRARADIVRICRRHGARDARVFGSVATGSASDSSDIDLLVELEPGRTLFDLAALHDDLEELLGHEVDILTVGAAHGRLAHILDEAVPI